MKVTMLLLQLLLQDYGPPSPAGSVLWALPLQNRLVGAMHKLIQLSALKLSTYGSAGAG